MKYIKLIILSILLLFLSGCTEFRECETDIVCFEKYAELCLPSRVNLVDDGSNVRVTVRGLNSDLTCKVSLKVEAVGTIFHKKYPRESQILIGKTLNCDVDKDGDYYKGILQLKQELNKDCLGPIGDLAKGPFREIIVSELDKVMKG